MREGVKEHDIHMKLKSYKLELLGELGGVCFFYLMLNRTFFELNVE